MGQTVEGYLTYLLTGSPVALSLIGLARSIPMVFVSPFAGVLADRVNRIKLMAVSQLIAALITISLGILVLLGFLQVWYLYAAALMSGSAMVCNFPARQALVVKSVGKENVMNAMAVHSTTVGAGRIIGPQIATALIVLAGAAFSYFAQSLAYLISTLNLKRLQLEETDIATNRGTSFLANLRSGFAYTIKHHELKLVLIIGVIVTSLVMPYMLFLPAIASDVLNSPERGLALLMGASGAGGLIGAMVVAATSHFQAKGWLLLLTSLTFALLTLAFSLSNSMLLSMLLLVGAGMSSGASMTIVGALLQILVPDELRGRMGSIQMLMWGLTAIGGLPMGAIATVTGVPLTITISSTLAACLIALIGISSKTVRGIYS
tara:strand:+ start:6095 stop:7222 length:1128 start_codon:yes stop_codon:yes gene_type:complete